MTLVSEIVCVLNALLKTSSLWMDGGCLQQSTDLKDLIPNSLLCQLKGKAGLHISFTTEDDTDSTVEFVT